MNKLALIQEIENLTFAINIATEEIIYDIKKQEKHPTTHYIWRTKGDGKVRSRHAKFNGKIFVAWDNPPAGGYHPGEDYGCRCIAEPYEAETENLQERTSQTVTSAATDQGNAWGNDKLGWHYQFGGGKPLKLHEIGLLQKVINHAETYDQGGGSIFERVETQIFTKARQTGSGNYPDSFRRAYSFHDVVWGLGGVQVYGTINVNILNKDKYLMITAAVDYNFEDYFEVTVIGDEMDRVKSAKGLHPPFTTPFYIRDKWSTKIEAIIKK